MDFPRLQREVVQITRLTAQGQWDDVVQLKVSFFCVVVQALLPHESLFDAVAKGRTGPN